MKELSGLYNAITSYLFPVLEEEISPLKEETSPLSDKQQLLVKTLELIDPPAMLHLPLFQNSGGRGRHLSPRYKILNSFVAKAVYNFSTTKVLVETLRENRALRRLCCWESRNEVPSEATFCRAFKDFSDNNLLDLIHDKIVRARYSDKLVGHLSYDSTAISARGRVVKTPKPVKEPKKNGRPRKGERREPPPQKHIDIQIGRTVNENLAALPKAFNVGCKTNSRGHANRWVGYKLHLAVADGDVPIGACLSSASLHDSQAVVPLMQMSSQRVIGLYDVMDSAYDATSILGFSKTLGRIPIIDSNPRHTKRIPFCPAKRIRYRERTSVERVNADLKDNHGGSSIRVHGAQKVFTHLMFGLVVIAAKQLFNMIC